MVSNELALIIIIPFAYAAIGFMIYARTPDDYLQHVTKETGIDPHIIFFRVLLFWLPIICYHAYKAFKMKINKS